MLRDGDFVGRYGGEEFLMLLPDTDGAGVLQVAEAIRSAVGAISLPGIDRPITASIGVAVLPDHAGEATTLFRMADRALYAAKNRGRDRVESATTHETDDGATHSRMPEPIESGADGGDPVAVERGTGGARPRDLLERAAGPEDAFDVAVSALVMCEHGAELLVLRRPPDRTCAVGGKIWMPDDRGANASSQP